MFPTNRGIVADQEVVPVALPAPPVEVLHATDVTPTLSLETPLIDMAVAPLVLQLKVDCCPGAMVIGLAV